MLRFGVAAVRFKNEELSEAVGTGEVAPGEIGDPGRKSDPGINSGGGSFEFADEPTLAAGRVGDGVAENGRLYGIGDSI